MRLTLYALEPGIPLRELSALLSLPCAAGRCDARPSRASVNAELALERVPRPARGLSVGVLRSDLHAPGKKFVFGLAHLGGGRAVVSLKRLGRPGSPRFGDRWAKEALHEAGHAAGLEHCACLVGRKPCVMAFSPALRQVDGKAARYCPSCERRLLRKE
jgi:archaemetzincin